MAGRLTLKAVVIGFLQRQRLLAVIASSISLMNTELMFLRIFLMFFSAVIKQQTMKDYCACFSVH